MPTRSYLRRLIGSLLAILLLEISIVIALTYTTVRRSFYVSIADRLSLASHLKEEALLSWLRRQEYTVRVIAGSPGLTQSVANILDIPEETAVGSFARHILKQTLLPWTSGSGAFREIFVLADPGGRVIYSTIPGHERDFRPNDRYFVMGKEGTYIQHIYLSPVTYMPTITIAIPLKNSDGRFLAVLAAHLDLRVIDEVLRDNRGLGRTGVTYAVDPLNLLLSAERFGSEEYPRGIHSEGIDAALRGESSFAFYTNYAGEPVAGVYRWIEEMQIALLTEINRQEARAPIRRFQLLFIIISFGLIIAVGLSIVILSRRAARPILDIASTATQVAQGDLTVRAPVTYEDETGLLARAFNLMVENLQHYQLHLERLVRERTEQLETAQAELIQQERLAVLGRLTATVSHEIRNPLGTVRNALFSIAEDFKRKEPKRFSRSLELAERNIRRCDRIITELLDYARVRELEMEPTEIDPWLEELLEELVLPDGIVREQAFESGVVLRFDPEQLRRAVINLHTNAVQAVQEPGASEAKFRIETKVRAGQMEIRVLDRGPGVSEEARQHLFEPLFSTKSFGVGLGLSVVRNIAEAHGGLARLENRPEGGAVATLAIPLQVKSGVEGKDQPQTDLDP